MTVAPDVAVPSLEDLHFGHEDVEEAGNCERCEDISKVIALGLWPLSAVRFEKDRHVVAPRD